MLAAHHPEGSGRLHGVEGTERVGAFDLVLGAAGQALSTARRLGSVLGQRHVLHRFLAVINQALT